MHATIDLATGTVVSVAWRAGCHVLRRSRSIVLPPVGQSLGCMWPPVYQILTIPRLLLLVPDAQLNVAASEEPMPPLAQVSPKAKPMSKPAGVVVQNLSLVGLEMCSSLSEPEQRLLRRAANEESDGDQSGGRF